MADRNEILLFGLPRSGTTWIGKVFDSHPNIAYRHETDSFFRLDSIIPLFPKSSDAELYKESLLQYLEQKIPLCSVRTCGKSPLFRKTGQSVVEYHLNRLWITINRLQDRITGSESSWNPSLKTENMRIAWKSIESSGRLGVLLKLFPDMRGVFILRHPCGYIASVLRGESKGVFGDDSTTDKDWGFFQLLLNTELAKKYPISLDALKNMSAEQRLAWRWVLFNDAVQSSIKGLKNCYVVRYESLCKDPMSEYMRLFQFAGLEWMPQTHEFLAASTTRDDDSYYGVFKNPLVAANSWKDELSAQNVDQILEIASHSDVGNKFYGREDK